MNFLLRMVLALTVLDRKRHLWNDKAYSDAGEIESSHKMAVVEYQLGEILVVES